MKTKIPLMPIIISSAVIIIILIYVLIIRRRVNISSVKTLSFSYSTGTAMDASVSYELVCETDKCIAKIKPEGTPEEESVKIETTLEIKDKIETILKEYEVEKWNGFDKNDPYVLDGNSFYLNVTMENADSISASGYMKWPKNYSDFKNNLDIVFSEILNSQNKDL
ncbi:MAG: hypothetical protein IKG27_00315 [Bacilli bacterium]|nr:hypothetical protein [Bacilli bacterium]